MISIYAYAMYSEAVTATNLSHFLGNNILIVAHASSLEACTCQLQGLSPQNSKDFVQMVRKVIFSPTFMGPVVLCVFVTVGLIAHFPEAEFSAELGSGAPCRVFD